MTQAFPLHWPEGWPRTKRPVQARFNVSFVAARDRLLSEVQRFGGHYPVLSTNIELRRDGLPYANQPEPTDKGVSIYFDWKGSQRVLACDRWDSVKDNMRALEKTIEAMRGIERWGATDLLERAFSAFTALPPPGSKRHWREVLDLAGVPLPNISWATVEQKFRELAKERHPDMGGSAEAMAELNRAREEAREIGS